MSETMKAIEIRQPGPPSSLQSTDVQIPHPNPNQILIRVVAAGVNRPDIAQRQGNYAPPPGASPLPGLEVSGIVSLVGEDVKDFKIGDKVCALVNGGGYAEFVAVESTQCLPIPSSFSFVEAAALPETFFTCYYNIYMNNVNLQPGQSLLVHGGASGIGTTAIQLASALGSRVFVTAGSDEKVEACKKLGADVGINYRKEDFAKVVKEKTDGKGVDVILDMVGGSYTQKNLEALAHKGRLSQIATLEGAEVKIDLKTIMMKRLIVTGSTLRPRTPQEKGEIASNLRKTVWPLLEERKIVPVIHKQFHFLKACDAHTALEEGSHVGKIVLTTDFQPK